MPLKYFPAAAQPREKLLARGAALSNSELLTLLLRTRTAGRGVLQMAQKLRAVPGQEAQTRCPTIGISGISGLLNAEIDDLRRIKGMGGTAKRAELAAMPELARRRALAQQLRKREVFSSPGAVKQFLQLHLAARPHQVFAALFPNAQIRLRTMEGLFRPTLAQASVYPREVAQRALHHGAAAVVLAHSHPGGTVQPSRADEAMSKTLKAPLALVDVRVLDHVIVAPGGALSLVEKGLL